MALITFNVVPENNDTFKYRRLGPMAIQNHAQYCRRHGYTFIHEVPVATDRPACWAKIPAIMDALERHRWVAWADSDALVANPARRLEEFCDPACDLIVQSPRGSFEYVGSDMPAGLAIQPINTGVFLVQRSAWSEHFLWEAYAQTAFISTGAVWDGIGEQEALIHVLRMNPADTSRIRYVETLQCHPRFRSAESVFLHFYGNHARHRIPLDECEAILQRWERTIAHGDPLPDDLARFHWCCIQNKTMHCSIERGDVDLFLYRADEISTSA